MPPGAQAAAAHPRSSPFQRLKGVCSRGSSEWEERAVKKERHLSSVSQVGGFASGTAERVLELFCFQPTVNEKGEEMAQQDCSKEGENE